MSGLSESAWTSTRAHGSSLMLSDVVVRASLLVHIISLKPRIRHVFTVHAPAHSGGLQEVDNGLHFLVDPKVPVGPNPVPCPTYTGDIVWLTGMRDGLVIGERDSLAGYPLKRC